jgi:hypothetical protein
MVYRDSHLISWQDLTPVLRVKLGHELRSADGTRVFPAGSLCKIRADLLGEGIIVHLANAPRGTDEKRIVCSLRELREGTERFATGEAQKMGLPFPAITPAPPSPELGLPIPPREPAA